MLHLLSHNCLFLFFSHNKIILNKNDITNIQLSLTFSKYGRFDAMKNLRNPKKLIPKTPCLAAATIYN